MLCTNIMLLSSKENTVHRIERIVHSLHRKDLMNCLAGWVRQVICEAAGRDRGATRIAELSERQVVW